MKARTVGPYLLGLVLVYVGCVLACGAALTSDREKQLLVGLPLGLLLLIPAGGLNLLFQVLVGFAARKWCAPRLRGKSSWWILGLQNGPALIFMIAAVVGWIQPAANGSAAFRAFIADPVPPSVVIGSFGYSRGIGDAAECALEFDVVGGGQVIVPLLATRGYALWTNQLSPLDVAGLNGGIGYLIGGTNVHLPDGCVLFYKRTNDVVTGVLLASNVTKAYLIVSSGRWMPPNNR
jgi:hypothetical protein